MIKKLKVIMLVDDDQDDNFFHEREIQKTNPEIFFIEMTNGLDALEYLESNKENKDMLPDLIFLDINMPHIDGWEFLDKYNLLDKELQDRVVIIMLSTSGNPEDIDRAMSYSCVWDYITKPLKKGIMEKIIKKYFSE
jgi:response regulator RpfG family c-di-GMP phosphodiesterase